MRALKDNYIYLLHDSASSMTAAVDPSEAAPVLETLRLRNWRLTHILNTHHHWDHTGGNLELKADTSCLIVGARIDSHRIPGIDITIGEGEVLRLGGLEFSVLEIPGHTRGHIAFWTREDRAVFCGDTLFSLGCGRLFEGAPSEMWRSLKRLRALPPETDIFCGHEYTEANLRFALSLEGNTPRLQKKRAEISTLLASQRPTLPSKMGDERALNPFLRADDPSLRRTLNLEHVSDEEAFAEIRYRKDRFKE